MRRFAAVVLVFLVGVGVVLGALWGLQRQLIYLPGGAPRVAAADVAAQETRLRTEDGLDLAAWWFPAAGGRSEATVLVAPGNAGSRADRVPLARALAATGRDVLVLEYRGYGGNPGRPDEEGLAADARAAHDHLARDRGVDPARIVLFGESLGAAVTVRLALERPVAAVVLRSPFTGLADVGARAYPFLPVRLLLRDRYPSVERVPRVPAPVTVVAGTADEIVPVEQSRTIADAAGTRPIEVPGARHNDPELVHGPRVVEAITAAA